MASKLFRPQTFAGGGPPRAAMRLNSRRPAPQREREVSDASRIPPNKPGNRKGIFARLPQVQDVHRWPRSRRGNATPRGPRGASFRVRAEALRSDPENWLRATGVQVVCGVE